MDRLNLRIELHENGLDPVSNWIARMVYVIEVLAKAAWQNMLVIFLILRITPSQGQEDGQRRPQTEKVFNSKQEARLGGRGM